MAARTLPKACYMLSYLSVASESRAIETGADGLG